VKFEIGEEMEDRDKPDNVVQKMIAVVVMIKRAGRVVK
jgi:hypothetical protein